MNILELVRSVVPDEIKAFIGPLKLRGTAGSARSTPTTRNTPRPGSQR